MMVYGYFHAIASVYFRFQFNLDSFFLLFISCSVCQWVSGRCRGRRNARIQRNRIEIVKIDSFFVSRPPKTVDVDGESEMIKYACGAEIIADVIQEQTRVSA